MRILRILREALRRQLSQVASQSSTRNVDDHQVSQHSRDTKQDEWENHAEEEGSSKGQMRTFLGEAHQHAQPGGRHQVEQKLDDVVNRTPNGWQPRKPATLSGLSIDKMHGDGADFGESHHQSGPQEKPFQGEPLAFDDLIRLQWSGQEDA